MLRVCHSFNSTIGPTSRASSARFTPAYNNIMFSSLSFVVVVHAGCHRQDHRCVNCAVNCTVQRRSCCSHCSSTSSIDSQLFVQNRDFCLPHLYSTPPALGGPGPRRNVAITFGKEKLEWCDYPTVKKIEDTFIRFDRIHERDTETDRQTDRHRMTAQAALAYSIARQQTV